MKKVNNLLGMLVLVSSLASCGGNVVSVDDKSTPSDSTGGGISNNDSSITDDPVTPVEPEVKDSFDVIYDNNTTSLTDIKVYDKDNVGKKVTISKDGGKDEEVGTISSDGFLSLSWTVASLDKNTITFKVEGTDHSKTIQKLTKTDMNALQRSYGFQNAYCSTYEELMLQTVYCAENGSTRYKTGQGIVLGDSSNNIYDHLSSRDKFSYLVYPSSIIDENRLNQLGVEGNSNTKNGRMASALMKELNIGVNYSDISSSLSDYTSSNIIGVTEELKSTMDNKSPSTATSNLPSYAGYKPYFGSGVSSLPIESKPAVSHVSTGFSVYTYVTHGYRPICEASSSAEKVYNNAKSVLKSILGENMSEAEKALAIYDWITFRGTYNTKDINSPYNQLIDGLLKDANYNLTVCNGYALTFATLASMAGLEAKYVTGYAGEAHAWNEVKVDGKWYCVDSTWGKSVGSSYQNENHQYFLLSFSKLSQLTTGGRTKTATYSYPSSSLATNENYPYYQNLASKYEYNGKQYSRYLDSEEAINRAASYVVDRNTKLKNGTLKNDLYKATFTGYSKSTSSRATEEFGFKSLALLKSFQTKILGVSMIVSDNYDSYSLYLGK